MPGEAGRILVQTYFESEHSRTADIHPKVDPPPLIPVALPSKKHYSSRLSASASHSIPYFRSESHQSVTPFQNNRPFPGVGPGHLNPIYPTHTHIGHEVPVSTRFDPHSSRKPVNRTPRQISMLHVDPDNSRRQYPVYGPDGMYHYI